MASKVLLPKFGQTVETSEVTQWLKQPGDAVRKGDVLCEIATDKSSLEVESPYEGTLLTILLEPGRAAPVGCVIALLGAPGEAPAEALLAECRASQVAAGTPAPAPLPAAAAQAPAPVSAPLPVAVQAETVPPSAAAGDGRRHTASPRARRLAEERDVPLAVLAGSGEDGRIVEADVRAYLDEVGRMSPAARAAARTRGVDLRGVQGSGTSGRIMLADVGGAGAKRRAPVAEPPPLVARLEKPSPMRRAIAQAMATSASTIPAFQLEATIDAASLIARREAEKAAGAKVGYGDLIARAVALTIRRFPAFAAQWRADGIAYGDRVHIGFAVAVPGGLVVPVVHDCDRSDVRTIAQASARLVERARASQLTPEDYAGACFTLSNLGGFPIDRFTAIVPPGQSGILAIGRIRDEVVVRGGGIFPAKLMSITLSADHRLVDGADGARFLAAVKESLEDAEGL